MRRSFEYVPGLGSDTQHDERELHRRISAEFRGRNLRDIGREVLEISRIGLKNRARKNRDGFDETSFLSTLDEVVARGTTSAEEMLNAYQTRWGGSIEPVFLEYAY